MKALSYLNKFFVKYKYRLIIGTICTIIAKILSLIVPILIGDSIDGVEKYINGETSDLQAVKNLLLQNILLMLGAVLLGGVFTFIMRQAIINMSRYIEFDLKNEIFEHYQKLSLNFYKKNRTGDLMNRISEDVSKVRMYFGPAIMYSINMITLFVVVISYMVKKDVTLTLYTLIPLPVLSVSIYFLSREINKRSRIKQETLSKLTSITQEFFSGMNVIKAYGIEKPTFKDFNEVADESKEKNIDLYKLQALFFPLMVLLIGISNIMVIYIGGLRYINGQITNFGVIAEFIIYVNMLTWPVAVVGWVTSIVQEAEASQKRINEFLEVEPEIRNSVETPTNIEGKIEFKNVTFTYDDTNTTALKNVSFTLEKGKMLAILGKTGSGKSTIAELIARLYDVDEGEILIDNVPIKEVNLTSLRNSIGFVPQEAFLFSDTIANNIKFGDEDAVKEVIVNAAKNAHIHNNIEDFSKSYETFVGERGVTLSGGQKQRISIARAIIKEPEILIFDDCLSAVDTETEEIILNNLNAVSKDKTTIIIGHRVSSAKNADLIIVLDEGRIVQKGTHDELLNQKGFYQKIYNQQLMEQSSQ
ncbi:ABC transporter ATP-binding protein [Aureibaculum sp. 2210JD6-5]|uniref:ABC transporter ATP-binding protein n=1 Tax=Aureibaculum sp. 2210JD6-5 TaxID=3103957 RepID=UPI002AAD9DA0|nr:ABC transporter ATP-binding protein [Aureibaculum sp. 2210JD6-5]MDY7395528.1 ABC transporter ATP-binding protein [Aureibaculum sp. 2210JD6-5]